MTWVIALGLLLALAATVGPPPPLAGEPGASLTVRLPPAVQTIVLALFAFSAVILLALQRPGRPTEDEPLPARARQRRSAWAALLPLPLLGLLAVIGYLVWHRWSGRDGDPLELAITAVADLLELLARARKPPTSVPFFDLTIAALLLLLALGISALLVLIALADPLEKWWARRAAATIAPPLPDIADGLDDLRVEPDPRRAILRAYGRFERALSAARAPRAPGQTPTEFMRTTVARLPVPLTPVARLTGLLEIARFSDRPLGAEARDTACNCLDEIQAALATQPPPPETGTQLPPPETGTQPPPPETGQPRFKPGKPSDTEGPHAR